MASKKSNRRWMGIGMGALTSLPVSALAFLGSQTAGLPFIPFNVLDFFTRVLPRLMVLVGIDRLLQGSQQVTTPNLGAIEGVFQPVIAVAVLALVGAIFGLVLANLGAREGNKTHLVLFGLIGGGMLVFAFSLINQTLGFPEAGRWASILFITAISLLWGGCLGWVIDRLVFPLESVGETDLNRRRFLAIAGSTLLAAFGSALGFILPTRRKPQNQAAEVLGRLPVRKADASAEPPSPAELGVDDTSGPAASPALEDLQSRFAPAPGTRPEITSTRDFYNIDINTTPPILDAATWTVDIKGLVNRPRTMTLGEIKQFPSYSQFVTMSCISNSVGGSLISTAKWTGIRLRDLLEEIGLRTEARELYIEAADGFFESVAMDDMMDPRTLLVYEMNGEPLPYEHGYPLRIYIPDRFGMKQPKWITSMEAIDEQGPGYWVERGWSAEAIARTTSVFDHIAVDSIQDDLLPMGGIAWAGVRGISKVEIQIDEGEWVEAKLRQPPLSPLTWVQWRYDWPVSPGQHTAWVRTYDGDGKLQELEEIGRRPDGSTGVDSLAFEV